MLDQALNAKEKVVNANYHKITKIVNYITGYHHLNFKRLLLIIIGILKIILLEWVIDAITGKIFNIFTPFFLMLFNLFLRFFGYIIISIEFG